MLQKIFGEALLKIFAAIGGLIAYFGNPTDAQDIRDIYVTPPEEYSTVREFVLDHYSMVYPPLKNRLVATELTTTNRVYAHLTDGSIWEVLSHDIEHYNQWLAGESLCIEVRKGNNLPEVEQIGKLSLYNYARKESVDVELLKHISEPIPLTVSAIEPYELTAEIVLIPVFFPVQSAGSTRMVMRYLCEWRGNVPYEHRKTSIDETDVHTAGKVVILANGNRPNFDSKIKPGKILVLSNGSRWIINENDEKFVLDMPVYIAGQEDPNDVYDFVILSEFEGQYIHTRARRETTTSNYQTADWIGAMPIIPWGKIEWARALPQYWKTNF